MRQQEILVYYQNLIKTLLAEIGRPEVNARHVEGWMRAQHPTPDHLDRRAFKKEVKLAVKCIDGPEGAISEELAKSYGI
jgi:hypothetical protein